jgi:hypothetical protein
LAELEVSQIFYLYNNPLFLSYSDRELAANCDAGPLSFEQIFQFNPKDGSTTASTNNGKISILSKRQMLVDKFFGE